MKTFLTVCIACMLLSGVSLSLWSQNIYATVEGDTVTLWESFTLRNCGSMYKMEVELSDYHLDWYQVDTGDMAVCLCVFDLSVSYGPLEPGSYTADVYYTQAMWPDTMYEGSTSFTISGSRNISDGGVISQYQSDCYSGVGISEKDENANDFKVYPVPVGNGQVFHLETNGLCEDAILEIFTISGIRIFSREYKGKMVISEQWKKEELFPDPGIYIARLVTAGSIITRQISVL